MGILVISWNFPPRRGGIENLIGGLCQRFKKSHPLWVITSYVASTKCKEEGIFRPKWPGLLSFSLYALYQGSLLLWRKREIKVILGGSAVVVPLVLILAKIFRCKAVVNVHGLDLIHPSVLYQILCVRWIRHCDRVIANSRYTASLAEEKEAKRDLICVMSPGVEMDSMGALGTGDMKKEIGLEGRKVLLYVGRLARRKGVKEFLQRSFVEIRAQVPEVVFLIVGANPTESLIHHDDVLGEIGTLVRDMGLQDHVRLLGWLSDDDLAKIYQAADLLVLPALSIENDVEGFGIVILEAAAAGKPCVATRVGGIPDAVEDGKSGILVEPGDYEMMSQAIVALLRDEHIKSAMGDTAKRRVKEEFGWNRIVQKYEELFESLVL